MTGKLARSMSGKLARSLGAALVLAGLAVPATARPAPGAPEPRPSLLLQVWERLAVPFVALTTIGAVGGAAFSHYIVFPYMIAFFGTFSSPDVAFLPRVEDTFGLYVKMLLGMMGVFQIPTVVFFLAKMGMVTARFLWKNTKYAILVIFIVSAVATPSSDPWNQTIFAAPMFLLYLLSILIAWVVAPRRGAAADTAEG